MRLPFKVLFVEDHEMVRQALTAYLDQQPEIQVVGGAGTAEGALRLVQSADPEVAIVDLRLPDMPGVELIRLLHERAPDVKVLVLSAHDDDETVSGAVTAGIDGYLLKDEAAEKLIEALRTISLGEVALSPSIARKLTHQNVRHASPHGGGEVHGLTSREMEVLRLIDMGHANQQIAESLSISLRTVESHVRNSTAKLGARSRVHAVRIARDRGLLN